MRSLIVAVALLATAAHAAEVRVSYLVDSKPLKTLAPAGTPLTFQLFSDATCATPVASQTVPVESTTLLEQLKLVKVKGGPKLPTPARIDHVMTLASSSSLQTLYLRVTGAGITPVGGACQLQSAAFNGVLAPPDPPPAVCAPDAVRAAPDAPCVDRYETSVWDIPPANTALIQKVKDGTATLADLTGGGATQVGVSGVPAPSQCSPEYPDSFPYDGRFTAPLYAASIPGVKPSACLNAYQATVACQLSGKRLLTSAEWLAAAAGTVDTDTDDGVTDCNTNAPGAGVNAPVPTGSRSGCTSAAGMYDAIGNVFEWTVDRPVDILTGVPTAQSWIRGGFWGEGTSASVARANKDDIIFNVPLFYTGFRCGK